MKHIALLLPDLEVGGAQRVMLMLAQEFSSRGHAVDLLVSQANGPLRENIPTGVNLVNFGRKRWLPGNFGLAIHSIFHIASWLRCQRPDIVLSTVTGINIVAVVARRISRVQLCLVLREAVTLDNVGSPWRLRMMRWLYPHADAVIALSPVIAEQMAAELKVPDQRIHRISNPVDTAYIRKQAEAPVNHAWFSDNQCRVLIAVGRLIPQKDYVTLLHAYSIASRQRNLRLLIVGDGPLRAMLEDLIEYLQLSDTCQLLGFDSNPWRWMAKADLYVLSSRWEGHPNTLLEALALGLPALVTAYDESTYELARQFHFTVVPPGNIEAMAEAMLAMERDTSCGESVSELASPRSVASEYLRLFSKVSDNCQI